MDLILLVVVAVAIGFFIWLLTEKIKMPPGWKETIQIGALIVLVLWLLNHIVKIPNVLGP